MMLAVIGLVMMVVLSMTKLMTLSVVLMAWAAMAVIDGVGGAAD